MERGIRVFCFKSDGNGFGVHDVFALGLRWGGRDMDGGDGVRGALGIGRDAKGFEVRGDVRKLDPVGFVGDGFVVEDDACWESQW